MPNPLGIKPDGSHTELDPVAVAYTVIDTTALAAYAGAVSSVMAGGKPYTYTSATNLTPVGRFIVPATGKGSGFWLLQTDFCSVKDFGAKGSGLVDDGPAIQAAVNYAKAQTTANGGACHFTVFFPNGNFRINGTKGIDVTHADGIVLQGWGNAKYVASSVNGNCTGVIFDFTGSTMSGVQGLSIYSDSAESTPARVAVQFALGMDSNNSQSGGLSCYMRDCYVQMASMPSLNGGLGSIPVVNIRSEQFSISDCVLKGDMGMLFSNRIDVSNRKGKTFNFQGDYYSVMTGVGSMGVINARAVSLETNGTTQPALLLNGVNGLDFQGYISIGNGGNGGQEYAIEVYQPLFACRFHGVIEGYRAVWYQAASAKVHHSQLRLSYANIQGAIDTPVYFMDSGSAWEGMDIGMVFGNGTAEMGNRALISTPLVNSGNDPSTTAINNSKIACSGWPDNTTAIVPHLWKQTFNTELLTGQAIEVKAGWTRYNAPRQVYLGNDDSAHAGTISSKIARFNAADKTTTTASNGGYYAIKLEGCVDVGGPGAASVAEFASDILIHQTSSGARQTPISTSTITNNSNPNPNYVTITSVSATVTWSGNVGAIILTVTTTGSKAGETVNANVRVSLQSHFYVNRSTLFD